MPDKTYKKIEIVGVSDQSIEKAIENAHTKASQSIHNLRWFEVQEIRGNFVEVDKPEGAFSHFYIEITSYSENLYNFNLTRREQNRDNNNFIFNSEPIFINSNINEGYGLFGARIIKSQAYLPTYFPLNGWIEY